MAEIGAYEAKTHLPRLLERVQQGERFVITKHGHPIAELVPFSQHNAERIREALAEIRAVRKGLARRRVRLKDVLRGTESLRDLAHQDHRY
jgi:prevent-host-death family protein